MTRGKMILIQKDAGKGRIACNYIAIIWKILTGQHEKEIHYSLESGELQPKK